MSGLADWSSITQTLDQTIMLKLRGRHELHLLGQVRECWALEVRKGSMPKHLTFTGFDPDGTAIWIEQDVPVAQLQDELEMLRSGG